MYHSILSFNIEIVCFPPDIPVQEKKNLIFYRDFKDLEMSVAGNISYATPLRLNSCYIFTPLNKSNLIAGEGFHVEGVNDLKLIF